MSKQKAAAILTLLAGLVGASAASAAPFSVFSTDFESGLAPQISPGTATLTGVQGFAGLGPVGNQFGGSFLRSETGNVVTLNLTGLPTHDTVTLSFLFAAIDSLDGTGTFPSGDFFKIVFDGNTLFSESFANALPSQIQSYVPPPGVELARHADLGFTPIDTYFSDSAYNFGADPAFADFAHSSSTLTLEFFIFGPGNQDINDESWAMDNLNVSVTTIGREIIPEPFTLSLFGAGLAGAVALRRRKSAKAA
ncbi:MAG: PEP-CTERM sorting domain-containing protein [Rhizomicrobium sp.]